MGKKTPNSVQFMALKILRGCDRGNLMLIEQNYSNFRSVCKIFWQSADRSLQTMFRLKENNNQKKTEEPTI